MVPGAVLTVFVATARSGLVDALLLGAYALLLVSLTMAFRARRAARSRRSEPRGMDERAAARITAFAPPAPREAPPTRARARPAPPTQPSPVPPPHPQETRPSPRQEEAFDTCEIVWWRGIVKSQFFAVVTSGTDDTERVAESPLFRWRGAEPPEPIGEPLAAHRTLVAILEADGWARAGDGDEWYTLRYRRPRPPAAPSA